MSRASAGPGGGARMAGWDAARVAAWSGSELRLAPPPSTAPGPRGVTIDTRSLAPGDLFVGLRGARVDGGAHAAEAIAAGAWGVLVSRAHAAAAEAAAGGRAALLVREDPLAALQALAAARRAELAAQGAKVVAITGSTGKTSTKDIFAALAAKHRRTACSPANLNTEIGVPLAILGAHDATEVLALELAMRGAGQIAELTAIASPDVGVIVNVGPAHLGLLGSLEAIAAAKAELIAGLAPGAGAVLPAREPLLEPHRRAELRTLTFGEHGDVALLERCADGGVVIACGRERLELRPSFSQEHNLRNLLAAVAAARLLEIPVGGPLEVSFTAMRGERIALAHGITLIDDSYNANPMSMRAALDELGRLAPGRRVAVLGDMLELGEQGPRLHRELGEYASARDVALLVAVGELAAEAAHAFAGESHAVADARQAARLLTRLVRDGDTVLVKGSRGVGLERVAAELRGVDGEPLGGCAAAAGAGSGRG